MAPCVRAAVPGPAPLAHERAGAEVTPPSPVADGRRADAKAGGEREPGQNPQIVPRTSPEQAGVGSGQLRLAGKGGQCLGGAGCVFERGYIHPRATPSSVQRFVLSSQRRTPMYVCRTASRHGRLKKTRNVLPCLCRCLTPLLARCAWGSIHLQRSLCVHHCYCTVSPLSPLYTAHTGHLPIPLVVHHTHKPAGRLTAFSACRGAVQPGWRPWQHEEANIQRQSSAEQMVGAAPLAARGRMHGGQATRAHTCNVRAGAQSSIRLPLLVAAGRRNITKR